MQVSPRPRPSARFVAFWRSYAPRLAYETLQPQTLYQKSGSIIRSPVIIGANDSEVPPLAVTVVSSQFSKNARR
jgi:hypothetical protein